MMVALGLDGVGYLRRPWTTVEDLTMVALMELVKEQRQNEREDLASRIINKLAESLRKG